MEPFRSMWGSVDMCKTQSISKPAVSVKCNNFLDMTPSPSSTQNSPTFPLSTSLPTPHNAFLTSLNNNRRPRPPRSLLRTHPAPPHCLNPLPKPPHPPHRSPHTRPIIPMRRTHHPRRRINHNVPRRHALAPPRAATHIRQGPAPPDVGHLRGAHIAR